MRWGSEVFHTLKKALQDAGHNTNVGDEGGFAPNLHVGRGGARLRRQGDREGRLPAGRGYLSRRSTAPRPSSSRTASMSMKARARRARSTSRSPSTSPSSPPTFPIISIEDGMSEDDWDRLEGADRRSSAPRSQLVGDDLFVTNTERLSRGIKSRHGQLDPRQGQPDRLADRDARRRRDARTSAAYTAVMSHRSGETEDSTIADLAVATNCGQIKTGSLARSDRTGQVQPADPHRGAARHSGRICRPQHPEGLIARPRVAGLPGRMELRPVEPCALVTSALVLPKPRRHVRDMRDLGGEWQAPPHPWSNPARHASGSFMLATAAGQWIFADRRRNGPGQVPGRAGVHSISAGASAMPGNRRGLPSSRSQKRHSCRSASSAGSNATSRGRRWPR